VSQFAAIKKINAHNQHPLTSFQENIIKVIKERSSLYGAGYEVTALGGLNEEVERELEREQEQEVEVKREIARVESREETDWEYSNVLFATKIEEISALAQVRTLNEAAAFLHPASVRNLDWSAQVYCTTNFLIAAADSSFEDGSFACSDGGISINEYLRPVDAFLLLPSDCSIVLLSEREANSVLKAMLEKGKDQEENSISLNNGEILMHLCYACDASSATQKQDPGTLFNVSLLPLSTIKLTVTGSAASPTTHFANIGSIACVKNLVSAQLLNGDTTFVDPKARQWIELEDLPWLKELQRLA
jgi:hypothetical protein